MEHRVKKIKFRGGRDANRALMRKLALNFMAHGHLETTTAKAKVLKSMVDRLAYKANRGTNADINVLLKHLGDQKSVAFFISRTRHLKEKTSGFVRLINTKIRLGDGASLTRIEWVIQPQSETVVSKISKTDQSKPEAAVDDKKIQKIPKQMAAPKAEKPIPKTGTSLSIRPKRKIP